MNVFSKMMKKLFAAVDDLIEKMPVTTKKMIQQLFYTVIFICSLVAVFTGISLGRKAADKGGVSLIDSTNDSFEIQINRERDTIGFSEMVNDQDITKFEMQQLQKGGYESGSSMQMSTDFPVIESEGPEKNSVAGPEAIISGQALEGGSGDPIDREFSSASSVIEAQSPGVPQRNGERIETPPLSPVEVENEFASQPAPARAQENAGSANDDIRAPAERQDTPRSGDTDIREASPILPDGDPLE